MSLKFVEIWVIIFENPISAIDSEACVVTFIHENDSWKACPWTPVKDANCREFQTGLVSAVLLRTNCVTWESYFSALMSLKVKVCDLLGDLSVPLN